MLRRDFLKGVAGLAGTTVLAAATSTEAERATVGQSSLNRPNILMITADDLGCDSLGCFGNKTPDISPNIDKFASQGVKFERAFVTVAICQPSRSVWITGRYPHRNGAVGFNPVIPPIPMLGGEMRKAGYYTGVVGKVGHFAPVDATQWDYAMETTLQTGRSPEYHRDEVSKMIADAKARNKPFFIVANCLDPHRPFSKSDYEAAAMKDALPTEPSRLYNPNEVDVPGYLPDTPEVRQELVMYYNSVKRLDDNFASVMSLIDSSELRDNTIVVFQSDNGAPLPFGKASCYVHSCRTPLLVRWPGVTRPGSVDNDHFVSGIDIMPTILDIAGAKQPEYMDGYSFAPVIKGQKQPERDHVNVVFHRDQYRVLETRACHNDKYGYIYNAWRAWMDGNQIFVGDNMIGIFDKGAEKNPAIAARKEFYLNRAPEELYDYSNDPHALHNLADDPAYADVLDQMRKKMQHWLIDKGDPCQSGYLLYMNKMRKK